MSIICERCGFPAQNLSRLIKHINTIVQCPSTKSRISHEELINKLRPPPSVDELTCTICKQVCKTLAGVKIHMHACKAKNQASDHKEVSNTVHVLENVIITPPNQKKNQKKTTYIHKNMSQHKDLKPFNSEIVIDDLKLTDSFLQECCASKKQGIIDLFVKVHNHPDHDNLKWHNDKLIVYDGKGWTDMTELHLIQHLGSLFSILEEKWCDYQMNIRCGVFCQDDVLSDTIQKGIDEFFYTSIVDDESVYFYCKSDLEEYLQTLKNI
jgi:hypothetical protein